MVMELNPENFAGATGPNQCTLVAFTAPWCGACKNMKAEYQKASKFLREKGVLVANVNCEEHKAVAQSQGIKRYPTIFLYNFGQKILYEGVRTGEAIETWVLAAKGSNNTRRVASKS